MATFAIDLISGRVFLFVPEFGSGTGSTGTTSGTTYPEVNIFSDLPNPPSAFSGQTYLVRQPSGTYVSDRKEAGLYFSNGTQWYRLGNIPSFFLQDNFQVYNTGGTSGIKFVTSGITGSTFRNFIWQNKDGTVALLQDLDTKVDKSVFDLYTGTTAPTTFLQISDFNNYSATTEVRLIGIENDIQFISGATDTKLDVVDFNSYTGDTRVELDLTITGVTNGLSKTGRNVLLGGTLTQNTTILGDSGTYSLGLTGLNALNISFDSISTITDLGGTGGIRYGGDYSGNFVNRSLVDKAYVDSVAAGLDLKESVKVGTTTGETNIDLGGGTFSGVIDGYTLIDGDRVLIKNQDSTKQDNGIYVYSSGSNSFGRAVDFVNPFVTSGAFAFIETGTTNGGSGWVLVTQDPISIGTTPLTFTQFSSTGKITAGIGIDIVNGVVNFDGESVSGNFLEWTGTQLNVTGLTTQSDFNSFTALTESNISFLSGVTDTKLDTTVFTGYSATTDNTLTILSGLTLQENSVQDTFDFPENNDGYIHRAGRALFNVGLNFTGNVLDKINPKAIQLVSFGDKDFGSAILADVNDLDESSLYGINVVSAATSAETKVITYGIVTGVNTSSYNVGSPIYIDPANKGEFVTVKPSRNAYLIGNVYEVDSVNGSIFINSIRIPNPPFTEIPNLYDKIIFTADEITTTGDTFFLGKLNNGGTISSDTINGINVPRNTPTPCDQDVLTEDIGKETNLTAGEFFSELFIDTGGSGSGVDEIKIEVYKSTSDGNAIDSGISGLTTGTLGVRPIVVLTTGVIDLSTSAGFQTATLRGLSFEDVLISSNERLRFRIIVEKIGGTTSLKDYFIQVGQNLLSFISKQKDLTDEFITGGTNGLSKVGSNLVLGGTLTGNTLIDIDTTVLDITGTTGSSILLATQNPLLNNRASVFLQSDSSAIGRVDDDTGEQQSFQTSPLFGLIINDEILERGVNYGADYSSNYTNRTLVDKEYVDTTSVNINLFTGYTATTEIRLQNIETDIIFISGVTSDNTDDINFISGVTDTKLDTTIFTGYTASTVSNELFVIHTGGTDVNTVTPTKIIWHSGVTIGSAYSYTGGTALIILEEGEYEITYNIPYSQTVGGANKAIGGNVLLNNTTTIDESSAAGFTTAIGESGSVGLPTINITFSANDRIDLICFRTGGGGQATTSENGNILIKKKNTLQ